MKSRNFITKITTLVLGLCLSLNTISTITPTVLAVNSKCTNPDVKEIKAVSKEIKSLTSTDYKDLEFLKPILRDKTVVCLGENFHRVAEYSTMKTRIIKYLHENLGFDVVAFEAGLGECAAVSENMNLLTPKTMMENSIFSIWHSKETLDLFKYIKQQSTTKKPVYLAGYDMQFTTQYFTEFMCKWLYSIDENVAKEYGNFEMTYIKECYGLINQYELETYKHKEELTKIKDKYEPQYQKLLEFMDTNKAKLSVSYPNNPYIFEAAKKTLTDRIKFVEMFMLNDRDGYEFRDKIMAENVEWITKVLYPGKKVILWAHNDHLAKNTSKIITQENGKWVNSFTSMGELLNKTFKDKEYVLGFYMNSGKSCTITTQKTFNIAPMPKGSLENTIMKSGYKYSFVDFSKQKTKNALNAWMFNPIYAGEDGMTSEIIRPMSMKFVPKEQYDGVIVIDKVNAPTLKY